MPVSGKSIRWTRLPKHLHPWQENFRISVLPLGVIGTGFLAIPVFTGSLSYILAESFGWEEGLDKKFKEARAFYIVIIVSLVIGLLINIMGISPMKALIYTAILYGVTSPVMIAVILHIGNNKKIMQGFTNNSLSNTCWDL